MKIEKMDSEDKKLFEEMYLEYEVYLRRIAYVNDIPVDYIEDVRNKDGYRHKQEQAIC